MNIIDCHVHASLQTDMDYLEEFLNSTDTPMANIIACSHSKCLSLASHALQLKLKNKDNPKYYVYAAPDISAYYLHAKDLGEYFASNAKELMDMGCDGIKLLEGKPQMRKAVPVPDFDLSVWEPFWAYAEENQVPILWHVNDPEEFWEKEHAPSFAISQGWLYDESYVNNEDQYRQVLSVLSAHPKLKIIFAHFFFMSAQLERLSRILDSYPNIMIDLTPGIEMYENFSNNYDESKAFFLKYYDRICYGTDIGGRCVLMGEDRAFDELENKRRPTIVRDFLMKDGEELIESDGHYIVGRPSFTMKCLGLTGEKLEAIMANNFVKFTGSKPRSANKELIDKYAEKMKRYRTMTKVYNFMESNCMLKSSFKREDFINAFSKDMQEKEYLFMFDTYLSPGVNTWLDETLLVIDAGGTNLRFAEMRNGQILSEKTMPMFGVENEINADEFFDSMAELISAYPCRKIGFCFSYAIKQLPNNDAEIIELAKEVKVSDAKGRVIGAEINKRLKQQREFFILNDTVACSLGVNSDLGLILGTGFNICFFDRELGSIVDPETGRFGNFEIGRFDKVLQEESDPKVTRVERQISGAYLGRLIEITAGEYFGKKLPNFSLKDVSDFLLGEGLLYSYFTEEERAEFKEIVNLLLDRAADKVAMCVECLSKGEKRISIGIEGSTIYKLPGYYEKLIDAIRRIEGTEYIFYDARNTISIGTARACK